MKTGSDRQPDGDAPASAGPRGPRRSQIGVRGLILAVACFGVISWAGRSMWEGRHPAIAAARGLRSQDPAARVAAVRLLSSLGTADPDRAVPALMGALADPDAEVRIAAAASLGAIGAYLVPSGSAPSLVRTEVGTLVATLKDPEPSVRIAAAGALQVVARVKGAAEVIDLPAVLEAIAAGLGDRDQGVREAALRALRQLAPLSSSGPPSSLLEALRHTSPQIRAAAIRGLAAFPVSLDPWLDSLLLGLEDGEPEVRAACGSAFSRYPNPPFSADAIPRLVKALSHPAPTVRSHVAHALHGHGGDPRADVAIPALLAVLREPIDPKIERLLKSGQKVDIYDRDPALNAAFALGRLAPGTRSAGEVVAALAEVVRSGHPSRRWWATRALGEIGPAAEPAVPVLIRVVRNSRADPTNPQARDPIGDAFRALGRIAPGTRSADEAVGVLIEALDPGPPIMVIEALGAFGPAAARAIPRLREFQKNADGHLKLAVDKALAAIDVGQVEASEIPSR